jgi:hypothetical protein
VGIPGAAGIPGGVSGGGTCPGGGTVGGVNGTSGCESQHQMKNAVAAQRVKPMRMFLFTIFLLVVRNQPHHTKKQTFRGVNGFNFAKFGTTIRS